MMYERMKSERGTWRRSLVSCYFKRKKRIWQLKNRVSTSPNLIQVAKRYFAPEIEPVPATGRSGPVRSGPVPDFRPTGLPFDRSVTVRPVKYRSTGRSPFDRSVTVRPVSYRSAGRSPFDRSSTARPVITDLSCLLFCSYYLIKNRRFYA
jgi:hypothetical protein